jgi:hypothetical protein
MRGVHKKGDDVRDLGLSELDLRNLDGLHLAFYLGLNGPASGNRQAEKCYGNESHHLLANVEPNLLEMAQLFQVRFRLLAIRLFMFSIGIGIGIGIEPCCVLRRVFMNGIASLLEFRQHRDDTVEQRLSTRVLLCRKRSAHLQNVLIPLNFLSIPIPIATPTPILLRQHIINMQICLIL